MYIYAGLYYCCRDKDVYITFYKLAHGLFKLLLLHPAVRNRNPCLGYNSFKFCGNLLYPVNSIVHKINLAFSFNFIFYSHPGKSLVEFCYMGLNRQPLKGWCIDNGYILSSHKCQIKRPWNRRSRKGEHIYDQAKFFKPLFVYDSKSLFFINNNQSQIFKRYVLRKEPVCTDYNICLASLETFQYILLFSFCSEPGEHCDVDRKILHPFCESSIMLFGQNSSRNKNRNLPVIHNRFKCSPESHLGLAVSYVSAKQAIHRTLIFHVIFYVAGGF